VVGGLPFLGGIEDKTGRACPLGDVPVLTRSAPSCSRTTTLVNDRLRRQDRGSLSDLPALSRDRDRARRHSALGVHTVRLIAPQADHELIVAHESDGRRDDSSEGCSSISPVQARPDAALDQSNGKPPCSRCSETPQDAMADFRTPGTVRTSASTIFRSASSANEPVTCTSPFSTSTVHRGAPL